MNAIPILCTYSQISSWHWPSYYAYFRYSLRRSMYCKLPIIESYDIFSHPVLKLLDGSGMGLGSPDGCPLALCRLVSKVEYGQGLQMFMTLSGPFAAISKARSWLWRWKHTKYRAWETCCQASSKMGGTLIICSQKLASLKTIRLPAHAWKENSLSTRTPKPPSLRVYFPFKLSANDARLLGTLLEGLSGRLPCCPGFLTTQPWGNLDVPMNIRARKHAERGTCPRSLTDNR